MSISKEQSIGKIGEHLVCADLIEKGNMAFIVAEGLNYDIIVDISGMIYRVQVRTTQAAKTYKRKQKGIIFSSTTHRFYIHQGKQSLQPDRYDADVFAFVALDIRRIAYVPFNDIVNSAGKIKQLVEFRTGNKWGKSIEKYSEFPTEEMIKNGYGWLPRIDAHLNPDQVDEIRSKYIPHKYTAKMLAEEYGVNEGVIRNALGGRAYKHKESGVFGGTKLRG